MEAIDLHKKTRCKNVMCETQLWKLRHELDLALLKIDNLQNSIRYVDCVSAGLAQGDLQNSIRYVDCVSAGLTQADLQNSIRYVDCVS